MAERSWNSWLLALLFSVCPAFGSEAQHGLIKELFLSRNYDALSRPVENLNDTVVVTFSINMNILVFVSDQDQVMKTNGYWDLGWTDPRFVWDPAQHGGIKILRLPVDKVWQPDIALTNTVDGQFWPNYKSNALIKSTGEVQWAPPFIFKSGCDTDPYYFPFDRQLCNMVFRSVTYNAAEVDLRADKYMTLKDYQVQPSGSWDIVEVPMTKYYRTEYREYGSVPVVSLQLDMIVARKPQFYVLTFLLPCVCIAWLTIFVFYLPFASGEKLCLAISVLFSIVVFLLILIDILPPSPTLPLMTKFLVFTFVCNVISAVLTTISVNWNYRGLRTHVLSRWLRIVFIEFIPKMIRIRRPEKEEKKKLFEPAKPKSSSLKKPSTEKVPGDSKRFPVRFALETSSERLALLDDPMSPMKPFAFSYPTVAAQNSGYTAGLGDQNNTVRELRQLGEYLEQYAGYETALDNVAYIAQNMEEQDEEGDVGDDWKFIALVADRLMLWIFLVGNALGTFAILLNSPYLFAPLPFPQQNPA